MRRVAIIASASGNGKTTLGRELARRMGVEFVELDALVHQKGWVETSDEELQRIVEPIVHRDGWVFDGTYMRKLGTLILDAADTIVWLDLPLHIWLPRLLNRTRKRIQGDELIFNENQESWKTALVGIDSLFLFALRSHFRRRRYWPERLKHYPVVRLRTPADVERWLRDA